MKFIFLTVLCASLVACAGRRTEDTPAETPPPPPQFEQGVRALDKESYAEAARIFDRLLVAKPASEQDLVTTFNSGAAYEGLGNCARASERYREVTRGSANKFRRLEAAAFFRLSLMYECLGQDVKAITALIDARKRGSELPTTTLIAEIPARLAAAYARLGNRTKALEYFAQANKGLKRIVSEESGKKQQDVLGQSLYLMGQLNPAQRRAEGDPVAYLQGLSMQQPYLLQAIELKQRTWSAKASAELNLAYDNIPKFKFTDPKQQYDFYVRGIQVARELKRLRMPNENPEANAIFAKADRVENWLSVEVAKVGGGGNALTPEAESRQGLRRNMKLADPTPPKKR